MATAWVQVFILTFAECVAPAGKTVCQEQQWQLQFLTRADCEYALEQLLVSKDASERVIVDRQKSGCAPSAAEVQIYESLDAIDGVLGDTANWRAPGEVDQRRKSVNKAHQERLAELMSCEDTSYVAPCRVGDIIVEDASGDNVEVWQRE